MKMNRFDYFAYDDISKKLQSDIKEVCIRLETEIDASIICPRSKALALTKLEELYMWCGKGIRNDQLKRATSKLQEESNDG
jgi:hypothetical protein